MARYFDRLAKRTGLLAGEPRRAPAARDDLVELNEETVATAPAVAQQTVARSMAEPTPTETTPVAPAAATNAKPWIELARPAARTETPVVQRKRIDHARPAAASMPPSAQAPAAPAPRAARSVAHENAASITAAAPASVAPASPPLHAPGAPSEHDQRTPARAQPLMISAGTKPLSTRVPAEIPAAPLRRRATHAPLDDLDTTADVLPAETAAAASPPRARSIASAPAAPLTMAPQIERVERTGTRVHIGRIDIAIHAPSPPSPAPPAPPVLAAPQPAPARAREPAFSPSRHYLRG